MMESAVLELVASILTNAQLVEGHILSPVATGYIKELPVIEKNAAGSSKVQEVARCRK